MRERAPRPRALYVQYTNPAHYPPIQHGARMLVEAGFDVRMLGTGRTGDPLRVPAHPHIGVSMMRFEPAGWRQKVHYLRFAAWVVATAIRWRPMWVFASDPLSCPVARLVSRLTRARVIYCEYDSPSPEQVSGPDRSFFWRTVMDARLAVGRESALCVLPNEQRSEAFRLATRQADVITVWNCPMPHEVAAARDARMDGGLRLVYQGTIVPDRLPASVLDAIAGLPDTVSLDVIGYETVGHRGYVDALRVQAARLGLADRVRFVGAMSRDELMRRLGAYDVGLSLFPLDATDPNQRTMTGASNKPFDYLARGLALLVSDLPDWRAMFVDGGFAKSCRPTSAATIQAALQWFLTHPREREAMGERGRRQILSAWNYERQFAPVLALMQTGVVDGRSRVAGVSSLARG